MNKTKNNANRNLSLDILRIIAALGVVVLHISSDYVVTNDVTTFNFAQALFVNSLTRFAVPVFVMISGAIFLDKNRNITTKKIWVHNILRLLIIFVIWSFAYYVFQCGYFWKCSVFEGGIVKMVYGMMYSTNHLWFIGMIVGLYAITPVLREWLKNADEKNVRYFLLIYLIFQIAAETVKILIGKSLSDYIVDYFKIAEISGYIGYFVLGWYLNNYELQKKMKRTLYILFPAGIVINFLVAMAFSRKVGGYNPGIYDSFGLFTYLCTITLFVFVKKIGTKIGKNVFLSELSKDTFGIYLMHMMIWTYVKTIGATDVISNPVLGALIYAAALTAACAIISEGLRRIPFVGRYIC